MARKARGRKQKEEDGDPFLITYSFRKLAAVCPCFKRHYILEAAMAKAKAKKRTTCVKVRKRVRPRGKPRTKSNGPT